LDSGAVKVEKKFGLGRTVDACRRGR